MKQRSRTEYSLINALTGMGGYALNTVLGFVCRIIFVRTLSAEYLGISGLFTNILSMLSLAELGISSAIIYALYKPIAENNENKITAIMQFYKKAYALIGTVVAVLGLAMLPFLKVIIKDAPDIKENLYVIYLLFLLNTVLTYFFSYRSSLMMAMQRNYIVSAYSYAVTIGQSFFQVIFLLLTHEYISYLLIQAAGGIFYNLWISGKVIKDYPYIKNKNVEPLSKEEKKSLFWNIKALTVNKLSGVLVNSTDNIVITYFLGISSVGFASNYILFTSTLDVLVTQMFNSLTGSVGNFNATADDEEKYKFLKTLNLANFWFYGWAAIGMFLVSGDMVKLLFGSEYVLPAYIPLILAINMYSIGMLHSFYTYKSTLGLFKYGQYILLFTGFINIILDIILGKLWGMLGIYLATLISRLCTNLWYEPYAIYKYGLKKNPILYLGRYGIFLCVLAVSGGLSWFLCGFVNLGNIANVVVKVIICTVVPNCVFVLSFMRTDEFKYLKSKVARIGKSILKR